GGGEEATGPVGDLRGEGTIGGGPGRPCIRPSCFRMGTGVVAVHLPTPLRGAQREDRARWSQPNDVDSARLSIPEGCRRGCGNSPAHAPNLANGQAVLGYCL